MSVVLKPNPMMDFEKNKLYLDILGIERVKALCKEAGEEAIYAHAIYHVWQVETIKERLAEKKEPHEIAEEVEMSDRTVERWAERLSGNNEINPEDIH